jgi:predicted RNA-binding protein with RPS1 domain
VEGVVSRVADFGVFIQIDGLVEGLLHVSETPVPRGGKLTDHYHEGDTVRARILRIEDAEMKVGLSGLNLEGGAAEAPAAAPERAEGAAPLAAEPAPAEAAPETAPAKKKRSRKKADDPSTEA